MTAPRVPKDLSLAPVAVAIDANLALLRDLDREALVEKLELLLDKPALHLTEQERRKRVLNAALRQVNLHGWTASVADDGARVRLEGGSVALDLGLSASILEYIRAG